MKLKKLVRSIAADEMKLDAEKRVITFPFSSELPVERWFGNEILSHQKGAPDLSRLNDGGALLWNHNMDEMIGCVDSAEIGSDKRGYCTVRFADTACANDIMGMVKDGILKNVSFGYQIQEMELTKAEKGQPDTYTATKWMPYEVSFVSVPADPSVGVGRSENDEELEVKIINKEPELKGAKNMPEVTPEPTVKTPTVDIASIKTDAVQEERVRISAITALGRQFKQDEIARQMIDSGKTVDEARAAVLEKLGQKQVPLTGNEAVIGLTDREIQAYSFLKVMNALANPNDRAAQKAASYELEVSRAAADKAGKAARGVMVPVDVLRHSKRDLTVGSNSAGGYTVATDLLSGSFIELLRNKMILQQAGATVLNGLVGNIAIPKQGSNSSPSAGPATAYWVAEGNAPTESSQTLAQVTMSPKTVGTYTDISRKLLLQSSIDVENFVKGDLASVLAIAIDYAGLYGAGASNEPQGLKPALSAYNSNSQESNFAAATPTFAEIVGLETKITSLNADIGSMKYICNASMAGALKVKEKASGYPVYVLEGGQMNGYQTLMSNQSASGDVWFGVWSQLMIGFWSGLDLMVDPYSGSTSGTVRIVALQDCDIAIRHHEAFARGNDTP